MNLRQGISDFRNGIKIIASRPKPGEGDRKLAKMSTMVMAQIPVYGINAVRTNLIKSIEKDLGRAARKGKEEVDRMVANALATPEYMNLVKRCGLDEPHIRVMGMEALKKYAKN